MDAGRGAGDTPNEALAKRPADFDNFLRLMEASGFTVKHGRGGAISFLVPGQERATRLRASTLGDGYDPEDIKAVIAGERPIPEQPVPAPAAPRRVNLIVDIQERLRSGKGAAYARWAKVYNLNHTDKLTNYIRFWQADGESEKTSIRTKTALGQLVEDGGFKGGLAPYGYDLVKSGRFNKRKHEVFELAVNEAEAAVVRIIFDKYVHEGFGAQRIATYLNDLGYRARTGKMWHHASVRGIICNLTYTGVLRSGESRSQTLPYLQIIAPELFEAAQHIRTSRANSAEQERRVPLNTRGQSLLAGNVFCGHCGSRLALTTNGKAYPCKEDAHRIVKRVRYICYGKTRKQTECDGQTGYTAHILDGIIDKVVRQIFERMKAIPKSEIVNIRYREKMEERKALLKSAKSDYAKAAAELDTLRAEVIKSLRGESAFSQDLLGSLIPDCETKYLEVQRTMEAAQAAYDEGQAMLDALNAQYDDIISWAEMYDSASMESKKMIVSCLIRRVEAYRDYRLHIDFNIDFEQFSAGLDISAIAA